MDYFNTAISEEITADSTFITADNSIIIIGSGGGNGNILKFIPREYTIPTLLIIHDELKNKEYNVTPKSVEIAEFITITFDFDFRQLASYQLEVFTNEKLIYRSKAKAI